MKQYLIVFDTEENGLFLKCKENGELDIILAEEPITEPGIEQSKRKRGRKPKSVIQEALETKPIDNNELNPWIIFDTVDDKEVMADLLEMLDPKGIPYNKKIKIILFDMLKETEVKTIKLNINNFPVIVHGVRVKNHIRNYITINEI